MNEMRAWLFVWLVLLGVAIGVVIGWWRATRFRSALDLVNDDLARRRQARDRERQRP